MSLTGTVALVTIICVYFYKFLGSCLIDKGQSYSDTISVTESGRPCISWDQQEFYLPSMFPELRGAGASCRNPGGISKKPWCYVNLTSNAALRWEYCDIEKCRKFAIIPSPL